MSYFIYLQSSHPSLSYCQEDLYNFIPLQNEVNSRSVYSQQEFFIPSTFSSPKLNFIELPHQVDSIAQISSSSEHIQKEELDTKEVKKNEKNFYKEIESAKKNSESNLINHFFSLFSNQKKTEKALHGCISSLINKDSHKEKLLYLFYNTIHVINAKRGRKYVNRKILTDLFDPEELLKTIPEIKEKIEKINGITIEELCEIFRRFCCFFFRTQSINSILTSKRISCLAKEEHLKKRRKITYAFFNRE